MKEISGILKSMKLAMFKDQKNPRLTDARFNEKHLCIMKLSTFIPAKFLPEYLRYFEPLVGETAVTAEIASQN